MGNWVRGELVWEFRWRTNLGMHDQDLLNHLTESLRQVRFRLRRMIGAGETIQVGCSMLNHPTWSLKREIGLKG
jgi:hypothetical protein